MASEISRPEALQIADQLVAEWTGEVKNGRGYTHDSWKPTDVTTRTEAVLKVAEWLLGDPGPARLVSPVTEPHLHRASCDDPGGNQICGYPPGPSISGT